MAELSRRRGMGRELSSSGPLTGFELRCFSQHGEDGVVAEILARIGTTTDFFVEFGIETGREGNCVFLVPMSLVGQDSSSSLTRPLCRPSPEVRRERTDKDA